MRRTLSLALAPALAALALALAGQASAATSVFQPSNCFNTAGSDGCAAEPLQKFSSTAVTSPDGHQVYSLSSEDPGSIVQYDQNGSTAALTRHAGSAGCIVSSSSDEHCTRAAGLQGPLGMSFSRDGTRAYVAVYQAAGVVVLKRDPATGELTALGGTGSCFTATATDGCTTQPGLYQSAGITATGDGKNVYVTSLASGNDADPMASIAAFDVQSGGALTPHAGSFCLNSGGANGCTALTSGAIGGIQPVATNARVFAPMSTSPGGIIQFTRSSDGGLSQPVSGGCLAAAAQLGCSDGDDQLAGTFSLAITSTGTQLYAGSLNGVLGFTSNGDNSLTKIGCITDGGQGGCQSGAGLSGPYGLALSADGTDLAVGTSFSDGVAFLVRDPTTGQLSQLDGKRGCITRTGSDGACRIDAALGGNNIPAAIVGGNAFYVGGSRAGLVAGFRRDLPPTCTDTSGTTPFGKAIALTLPCSDPDGDPLSITILSPPGSGKLGALSGNSVTYTPSLGFSGADSFTFGATAFGQQTPAATARLTVAPKPPAPVILSFSIKPKSFAVGRKAAFRFRLSNAARATITIKRHRKRVGVLTRKARKGANKVTFRGRVRGKALKPGTYRATLAARGAKKTRSVRFKIR